MKVVHGDLLARARDGHYDIIVHGCNCQAAMGAGIALQVRRQFPEALDADRKAYRQARSADDMLGSYSHAIALAARPGRAHGLVVVNAYTQTHPGRGSLSYEAIAKVFQQLYSDFGNRGLRWGYPAIGAGLAGGEWSRIQEIIDNEFKDEDHELCLFNPRAHL